MVQPSSQLLGSGLGQSGSTSYNGAVTLEPCASACCCSTACPMPNVTMPAASATPDITFRFCQKFITSSPDVGGDAARKPAADALVRSCTLPLYVHYTPIRRTCNGT